MGGPVSKSLLRDRLVAELEVSLAAARAAHAAAIEGATHAEAKPENDKDTRGLEQSYLARGVAQRVAELEAGLASVTRMELRTFGPDSVVATSALVTADEDGQPSCYFIAPAGGGSTIEGVQVITPAAPVARALLGKRVGDEVELKVGAKTRLLELVEIV